MTGASRQRNAGCVGNGPVFADCFDAHPFAHDLAERIIVARQSGAPDPAVIAKVQADLKGKGRDWDTGAGFRSMIDSVATSTPGLKAVRVRAAGEGRFVIEASASPWTFVGVVNELVGGDYGSVVGAVAFDDVIFGEPVRNEPGDKHAEDKLIGFARVRLNLLLSQQKPLPKKVQIFVSQSPCKKKCQPNLSQLKGEFPTIKTWVIYYKTLHQGTSGKQTKDSMDAINLRKLDGFHVFQFNEALALERRGVAVP